MAIETPVAPAPVAAPEPTTDVGFQAAALAKLEEIEATKPVEPAPAVAEAAKPAEPAPVAESEPMKKGFDALVMEKAKIRRKEAETSERLKLLEKYENAKTPLDLLMAKGFSYDDATRQLLKGEHRQPAKQEPEESVVARELRELRQQLSEERTQNTRREVQNKVVNYAKTNADKFPFVAAKQAEHLAFQYLQEYVAETNELPGKDIDESIAMSFQAVEADLEKQITEAANILTKVKKPAISVPGSNEKAVQAAESRQATQHTLTNSMASPGKPPKEPEPQTAEDYRALALAQLEARTTR